MLDIYSYSQELAEYKIREKEHHHNLCDGLVKSLIEGIKELRLLRCLLLVVQALFLN